MNSELTINFPNLTFIIFLPHGWEKWFIGEACYRIRAFTANEYDEVVDDLIWRKIRRKRKQNKLKKKSLKKYENDCEEPKEINWTSLAQSLETKEKQKQISFQQ